MKEATEAMSSPPSGSQIAILLTDIEEQAILHAGNHMCFNFHGVYILQICNVRGFCVLKFAVARYSGVEIFACKILADIWSESVHHNSGRQPQR